MNTFARGTRLLGFLLVAIGIVRLTVALVGNERADASGFVPGVGFGYLAVALGGLTLAVAGHLRERDYIRVAAFSGVMVWLAASTVALFGLPPGSLHGVPFDALLGFLVVLGIIATECAVGIVLVLIPLAAVVRYLLNWIPGVRESGVADQIRRSIRGRF